MARLNIKLDSLWSSECVSVRGIAGAGVGNEISTCHGLWNEQIKSITGIFKTQCTASLPSKDLVEKVKHSLHIY